MDRSQQQQVEHEACTLREEDYERLAVYIVPDVPCVPGTKDRAEKTLPRSLTLKPSVVLSTPNTPVRIQNPEPMLIHPGFINNNFAAI